MVPLQAVGWQLHDAVESLHTVCSYVLIFPVHPSRSRSIEWASSKPGVANVLMLAPVCAGNINQLVLQLEPYVQQLRARRGLISEFVNPKYRDDARTAFKSATRLECMMQVGLGCKVYRWARRCAVGEMCCHLSFAMFMLEGETNGLVISDTVLVYTSAKQLWCQCCRSSVHVLTYMQSIMLCAAGLCQRPT